MKKKILIGIISILLLVIIFIVIKNNILNKKTSVSQVNKAMKVRIAMVTFPGYGPLYLAKEKGFFGDLDIELKTIEDLGDIRAAVNSGDVDIYAATYDMYQSIKGKKPSGIGFLAIDESHGGDGIVVADDINSIADLKGKNIGAEPGFPPYLILQAMLKKEGMTLADVNFKDLPTTDAGNAFVARKLDAAAVFEPSLSASASARKGSKILITSAELPGLIQDLLFANEDFAKQNPKVLKTIAEGYFRAVDYISTHPDESYEMMAKVFNVSTDEMRDFSTGISWPNKLENIKIFDDTQEDNVFDRFKLVGDILEENGETDSSSRVNAYDKINKNIVESLK